MPSKVQQDLNRAQNEEQSLPCEKCAGRTAHVVVTSVDRTGEDGDSHFSVSWTSSYQVVQCLGCKTLSFRRVSSSSEDYVHDEDGEIIHIESESLYPSRIEGRKSLGEEAFYIPSTVRAIYDETTAALSSEAPILAGIGMRALVEAVCKEKRAVGNNLFDQIDDLVSKQLLTPAGAKILHKVRTLGNAAAHEVKPHSEKQLAMAMNVVEHLLKDVYILPKLIADEFDDKP